MSSIISVENLGKKYIIGHQTQEKYKTFRDILTQKTKKIAHSLNPLNLFKKSSANSEISNESEEFWALKDVSFDIKSGDRIGIIGRNGAGKSTLLKILSRITEPTTGKIKIKGRVASLLEVGTGFHPELTGRENIFLNGAILGMTKAEIKSKFDEIVTFAEIEKFLDTPVKRYSSGMYVRLAFAVAAHLEPEILIVDEVLAVGDAQFQKKCMGKMEEVGKEGRTVLFVSHNMNAVINLCNNAILLAAGQIICAGPSNKVINEYMVYGNKLNGALIDDSTAAPNKKLKIRKLKVLNDNNQPAIEFDIKDGVFFEIEIEIIIPGENYNIGFELCHYQYGSIFTSCINDYLLMNNIKIMQLNKGIHSFKIELPAKYLRSGDYYIKATSAIPNIEVLDIFNRELVFRIIDTESPISKTGEGRNGVIMPILEWKKQQ
ncbi:MAG: ABC transporter ATP-binding protein [Candidatus Wallbacteria bacterium]